LAAARDYRPTAAEEARLLGIEQQRALLLTDQRLVTIVDHGAGSRRGDNPEAGRTIERRVADVCRHASKNAAWCRLLFALVRTHQPQACLELGTCLGISAAYQAAALAGNGTGTLTTIEGAENYARIAQEQFAALKLHNVRSVVGRFQDVLPGVLASAGRNWDYIFIDGHHDGAATRRYFETIGPHLTPGALVIFDDILWSSMRAAWRAIRRAGGVAESVDLLTMGICRMQ
jgi:predicted O-methyltransferase YrrM